MDTIHSTSDLDFEPQNPVFPSPLDWRDHFIYFLLIDRFDNNAAGIPPYDPETIMEGRAKDQGRIFQGGNLQGIIRRLDYIKELGATAVWISPLFKNRQEKKDTYHGYGIQNFLEVDPRFGTKDDLRELVHQAHSRDMYIILDIIINHTGDNWAYPGDYPYYYWKNAPGPFDFGFWREVDPAEGFQDNDAVWPRELQDKESYKRLGQIRNWFDAQEAIDGDFLSLKELNITRADVLDTLIRSYKYWIAFADIDGFRMDTVKHMEDTATALFCNAIREYTRRIGKHNFFLFGEVVGDDAVIQRYIGRNTRFPGTSERFPSLDACLDFPLYFILEEVIKGLSDPTLLRERYEKFRSIYTDHGSAGKYFVTFVDNHDQMARPYRRFMHNNPYTDQMVQAICFLLTSQGVPCIYYGSEQNFDGGGDSDTYVRECMFGGSWGAFDTSGHHFFNPENQTYQQIAAITAIRRQEPILRYGRQYFREISDDGTKFGFPTGGQCTLAYSRILDDSEILITLNLSTTSRNDMITVDGNLNPFGSSMVDLVHPENIVPIEAKNGRHTIRPVLKAHSIALWKLKQRE